MRVTLDVIHELEALGGFVRASNTSRRIGQIASAGIVMQHRTFDEVAAVVTRADVSTWSDVERALDGA